MSITIESIDDAAEWDRMVEQSPEATIFHESAFLGAAEASGSHRLHRLAGYKGQEPVGLMPVFDVRKAGINAAFSPPPRMGILFQGPARLNAEKLSRRKRERRNQRFVEACLAWLDEHVGPRYTRVSTTTNYTDVRPFSWNEYSVIPHHTYELDLTADLSEIKGQFSKSLRRYIEPPGEAEFTVETQGTAGIEFIHEQVASRYEAQDREYTVPLEFLTGLYESLPDGSIHPYVASHEGERLAGILAVQDDETSYFMAGGGKPDTEFPANDQLHWEIIADAKEQGVRTYDLYGADVQRISEYKAKFNPTLKPYYELEKGTLVTTLASRVYRAIR